MRVAAGGGGDGGGVGNRTCGVGERGEGWKGTEEVGRELVGGGRVRTSRGSKGVLRGRVPRYICVHGVLGGMVWRGAVG